MVENTTPSKEHITIITPPNSTFELRLGEAWKYRELILAFFNRDLKVRYANTWAGWAWAIVNPLINIAILSFVFGHIANVDTQGVNSPLYTTIGFLGWTFYATMLADGSNALVSAQHLVQKVYFPRIVLILSKLLLALFDFFIMLVIVGVAMAYHMQDITSTIFYLPIVILHMLVLSIASALWAGALSVRYKDFRYIIPIATRIGMYITPIAYALSAVPETYRFWYCFNPLVGIIELYRFAILGISPNMNAIYISLCITLVLFFSGLVYFNKLDDEIADII